MLRTFEVWVLGQAFNGFLATLVSFLILQFFLVSACAEDFQENVLHGLFNDVLTFDGSIDGPVFVWLGFSQVPAHVISLNRFLSDEFLPHVDVQLLQTIQFVPNPVLLQGQTILEEAETRP